ncbi:hypothetical protein AAC387_Pa03g3580 [Persea americana]
MVMLGLSGAMNAKLVGSGEKTLVLAHGYGGEQAAWDQILPHLAQTHRVLVFDWKFSGAVSEPNSFDTSKYSSYEAFSDDLISLLEEMSLKKVVFVGHSMSGMIGCIASVKRPDLFDGLILLAASPRYLNSEDYEGGLEKSQIDEILSNIECNFHSWAVTFAAVAVGAQDPASVEKFSQSLQKMGPDVALALAKTVFWSDYRDVLDKVEVPCTIIQPTKDLVAPMSVAYYMEKKIKGKASVEVIEVDGHFPHLTCPQLLIATLDKILGSDSGEKKASGCEEEEKVSV